MHLVQTDGLYGAEQVILTLCKLARLDGQFQPVVGCIVSSPGVQSELVRAARGAGIEAYDLPVRSGRLLGDFVRLKKFAKSIQVGLLHSHGYKASVMGYLMAKVLKVQIVATCHLWFIDDKTPLKMKALVRLEKYLYRHFPAVVAVSEQIRDILIREGARPSTVHVINNGIRIEGFEHKETDNNLHRLQIVNVGRLTPQKAQSDLLAAAVILKKEMLKFTMLIVGDGELRERLQSQIDSEGLSGNVCLTGFREDIRALLMESTIFALPSVDEGMPISLLEAVAARIPVVATPVGDIPKLIKHRESGLLVPVNEPAKLAEALKLLAEDLDLRRSLSNVAHDLLREQYSSEAMSEKYIGLYRQILGIEGHDAGR